MHGSLTNASTLLTQSCNRPPSSMIGSHLPPSLTGTHAHVVALSDLGRRERERAAKRAPHRYDDGDGDNLALHCSPWRNIFVHQHDLSLNKKCLKSPRVVPVYGTLQIAHTYSTRKCVGGGRKERVRARKEEDSAQAFPSLPPQVRPAMPVSVGWGELSRNRQLTLPERGDRGRQRTREHGGGDDDGEGRMWTDGRRTFFYKKSGFNTIYRIWNI